MKQLNSEIVIILPSEMKDCPVRVVRGADLEELPVRSNLNSHVKQDTLVWYQNGYVHLTLDEIMWIKASSSYCHLYATCNRKFTLSYPLARIEERLPGDTFIRIHRSYLINIRHVKGLSGRSFLIGNQVLKISDEYRKKVFERFIFLGVRDNQGLTENDT